MPTLQIEKSVLILGATGPLGLLIVKEALSKNFKVTIYLRNPGKLSKEIKDNKNVTAPKTLFPHIQTFNTIISALGPHTNFWEGYNGTPLTDFYAALLQQVSSLPKSQARPYVLALSTPSQSDPNDSFSFLMLIGIFIFSRVFRGQYNEVRAVASAFQKYGEGTPWTLYRVGNLTMGDGQGVAKAGYIGDPTWKLSTSRSDIARWLVGQMELAENERKWVGKMPAISGP